MPTSRRVFLKNGAIASTGVALGLVPAAKAGELVLGTESHAKSAAISSTPTAAESKISFTRGIGVYPGDPREDFSPELVIDSTHYRNLALLRPAYHSSSYDYNLTAQLITDGIKDTHLPSWVSTSIPMRGTLPKHERELMLDHTDRSSMSLMGPHPAVQFELGGAEPPEIDRIDVVVVVQEGVRTADIKFNVSVSDGGRKWEQVGSVAAPAPASVEHMPRDLVRGSHMFLPSIPLSRACRSRFYEVQCSLEKMPQANYMQWRVCEVLFFRQGERVQIGGPYSFTSAWMSEGLGQEWVYVDLGAPCEFDRVKLFWIARAGEGTIQVSDDSEKWHDLHALTGTGPVDDVRLVRPAHGRYVRVLMNRPSSPDGYMLSEMEVYGRGGPVARPRVARTRAESKTDGRMDLAESQWRLQRSSLVTGDGAALSKTGYADGEWIPATVPGTVLTSYLNVGAIPDPNYGRNQLYVSDSFFYSDFWYRTEFMAPDLAAGKMAWLNFEGINWKAEIFLNGESVGRIDGGFMRGEFDVTGKLHAGKKNALAVRIEKNATPGSCKQKTWEDGGPNGGALGSDNPTYHASVGWDWIPTIRGRNTGIQGNVSLTTSGAITLESPFAQTSSLAHDHSTAGVSIEVDLVNHLASTVSGRLRGRFGDVQFEQSVSVDGSSRKTVKVDASTHSALNIPNPQLWWPTGYGDPHLYDVELSFQPEKGEPTDTKTFRSGIRLMTYSEDGDALKIWINGRRFIPRGGNWGFSESMLRYRAREYDAALRYHREMNFNMVRNWVGQVGDDAFYEACDRYGVMVWQDFWLANPWDGPDPDDNSLFMSNVKDWVRRIRNHASMALYCGRNEGFPPKPLDDGIRAALDELHPGMHYISSSADGVVGGGGPYWAMPLDAYPKTAQFPKLHSEIGMPNIPSIESVRAMMPEKALWPMGLEWGLHDFPEGGERRNESFPKTVEETYGKCDSLEEWVSLAHFVDYEGFRAEYEAQSKFRMGLLIWMSHLCWPSLLWQTYDYNLEPTAAYFSTKMACEPLHVQWNRVTDAIEVVNYSAGDVRGLSVLAEVLNMDGSVKLKKTATLDSTEDSTNTCMTMEFPADLNAVHFLRLALMQGDRALSKNLYMRGVREGNLRAIRQLAKARVKSSTEVEREGVLWRLTTEVMNTSAYPALMVRLKVVRSKSGDRIVPVIYDDNYFTLMPGERRTVHTEVNHQDTRGEAPGMTIGGFNVEAISI